jgi:two-component system NtrC family sensor kinase
VTASSGEEALRQLLKTEFVAILLDVQMPGMDGYEVAQIARSNPKTKDVPIIFLTAKQETKDDALRGYGTGAVDYLFKPISPIVLRSKVRVFVELHNKRKEAEATYEELRVTQSQLVQSAKMAALGELVAGVAHEINNPLGFATSHLKTARRCLESLDRSVRAALVDQEITTWEKSNSRLLEMGKGLERITDLVTQLRTFSRLDEGERKVINFRECIDSVLMILGHRLSDGVNVTLELNGPATFDCYPGPLNLALMNLLANAIDAVGSEGNIGVATEARGNSIAIVISVDGPGIFAEHQARIFEPFFTTKPVGKGTGLGLSITYSIAQKHKGSLTLSSTHQKGAVFTLEFPIQTDGKD